MAQAYWMTIGGRWEVNEFLDMRGKKKSELRFVYRQICRFGAWTQSQIVSEGFNGISAIGDKVFCPERGWWELIKELKKRDWNLEDSLTEMEGGVDQGQ